MEHVLEIDPHNQDASQQLEVLKNLLKARSIAQNQQGVPIIIKDSSKVQETEDGFIYEDENGEFWKLLFSDDHHAHK